MTDEAMKAFNKGQNTGTMFRLDLDVLKANKINSESYVRIWLTAWHNKLSNVELETIKKHYILWFGQQAVTPNGYPPLGIPANRNQLVTVAATGKCGQEYAGITELDEQTELQLLSRISGDVIADATNDYYNRTNDIRIAMDKFRHNCTVALGPKLSAPFDQGILTSYNQLIKWVYKKCNVTRSMESMADYFEDLDKAFNEDADTDCRILKYRMALNKMYQNGSTTAIRFPDIEDDPIQWAKAEEYSPILSLMFLYNIWKKMDKKTWTSIEDEFRGEIGGTNYTKANWMANKPRLFEIIDQKSKSSSSRATINRVQADDESDEDKMEIEIEPGMVMFISPKGPKNKRPQNWKSKVQKFNAAAKRGQRSNNQSNNNGNNRTNWNNQPASYWNCKMCPTDRNGQHQKHKRGQKCPKNGFIPQRMIAMVQQGEDESPKQEESKETELEPEAINTVRPKIGQVSRTRFQYDSSSEDLSS